MISDDNETKTWSYHECPDPNTCSGQHCVEWKAGSSRQPLSDICITWKETSCTETEDGSTGKYGTTWKTNVPCETDSELNCLKSVWHMCTIEPEKFLFDTCNQISRRCFFSTVIPNDYVDQLVLLYDTEVHLVSTDYAMTKLDLKKFATQTTKFQSIVGGSIGPSNELFVLDSLLSLVTIFRFTDNSLEYMNSWGKFGFKDSVDGLNEPRDIHVDQNNNVLIADYGNKCIKMFAFNGRNLGIFSYSKFTSDPPRSVCVDSKQQIHVLLSSSVVVLSYTGTFLFEYNLTDEITSAVKINTNYRREAVYITYGTGVVKYFRNGQLSYYIANNHKCLDETVITTFNSVFQDKYRNLYITAGEKILKVADRMKTSQLKAVALTNSFWKNKEDLYIKKNEYVQPWVYLRTFHRLWDNIEVLRSSLFYQNGDCKNYKAPTWEKKDLVIGQNEIVSNAVINRLISQLWDNLSSVLSFFKDECSTLNTANVQLESCCKSRITCPIQEVIPQAPELPEEPPLPPVEPTCGRKIHYEGAVSYPRVETMELGRNLGFVNIELDSYRYPDRLIANLNNSVVVDTGYRGAAHLYDEGMPLRFSFNLSLQGKTDPITNNVYPFADPSNGTDGYPRVWLPESGAIFQFYKNTSSSTLTLSVFAPIYSTLWDLFVSCPGQPQLTPTPQPTVEPIPTPTPVPTEQTP